MENTKQPDGAAKADSEILRTLLAMIQADQLGLIAANWSDASPSDMPAADWRKAILAAIAMGRLDILEMFIEKLGIEFVLCIAPDAMALALGKGDPKLIKLLIKRGWLRSSARRNAKAMAEGKVFGELPAPPMMGAYRSANGAAFGVAFLQGAILLLAVNPSGSLRQILVDEGASGGREAFEAVSAMGASQMLDYCKEHSSSVSFQAIEAMSACAVDALDMSAAEIGFFPLHEAAFEGDIALLSELIGSGLDVNERDPQGNTALMMAAEAGRAQAAGALMQAGADPMLVNEQGRSALEITRSMGDAAQERAMTHAAVAQEIDREIGRRNQGVKQMGKDIVSSRER